MTNDDVRRAQQRIADARTQRRADVDAETRPPAPAAGRIGGGFEAGDRVLDLRGGREGEVERVGPTDGTGAALVWVRFDDGSRGTRDPVDLLARPRPPAGRS